jgi:ATP-dependent 26S proteasome regulatory subunit
VRPFSWNDLDEVISALEAKIALPFENCERAAELGLKAKRGVLLAGPPGTGLTTIGRALAHRL